MESLLGIDKLIKKIAMKKAAFNQESAAYRFFFALADGKDK